MILLKQIEEGVKNWFAFHKYEQEGQENEVSDTSFTKKEENFPEKLFVPLDTDKSLIFNGKHKDATFDSKVFLANFSLSVKERVKQEYEHSIS